MEKRTKKPSIIINIIILAVFAFGACLVNKLAYDKGKEVGRQESEAEVAANIDSLANAVAEKSSDLASLQALSNLPSELNEESITAYLEALDKIDLKNANAKELLKNYKDAWGAIKVIYATEDNDKIKTEFETLKSTAADVAEKLQALYDQNITSALEKL